MQDAVAAELIELVILNPCHPDIGLLRTLMRQELKDKCAQMKLFRERLVEMYMSMLLS